MERREFIAKAGLLATWATIPITITACSDDDDDDGGTTGPDTDTEDVAGVVSVSNGHSHSVTLTGAQIDAGQNVVLTLTGSGHTHTVSLTADEVGDVADGTEVVKTSTSTEGHTHTVTFNGSAAEDVEGEVSVSEGHSHSVTLTGAQIDAGQNVILTLTGSGHTHTVSLTAVEVAAVATGTEVVKTSSSDLDHTHTVTFNPAPTPDVNGVVGVSNQHSHSVRLTGVQIDAGQDVILTLTNSGHTHTVELSAQEVGEIGAGIQVVKTSSSNLEHTHSVTFN